MIARLLGLDYGDSRIGLAISDQLGSFAHPYRTLPSGHRVVEEIRAIVAREQISGIVIGLPRNMDGTLGSSAAKAKTFGEQLALALPAIKILFWDERLTTQEAQRALHAAGKTTRQSRKMIDQVAAQILLQNYLDSLQWARLSNA
ncbi:MAG: Holliday junction resolvase RuvX [Verrucomicrobia bacterium]|nr:Holliday junction resolvase RuvX [Verrucomicrobiota bacterium]MBV8376683.1 Holliday junction resolvase RuvX [Verrucomicrobiota bacterium]